MESLAAVELPKQDRRTTAPKFSTTTSIDVADHVYILYFPRPGQGGGIRLLESGPDGWTESDPATLVDGTQLKVDDSFRAAASVAASSARVVVAIPTTEPAGVFVVERKADGWQVLDQFARRSLPRLDIGPTECVYMRSFELDTYLSTAQNAVGQTFLSRHCPKDSGFVLDQYLIDGVPDRSSVTRSSAQDGSFDAVVGADGTASFVLETQTGARRFGQIPDWNYGEEGITEASRLQPATGEAQSRIRMAVDGAGAIHMMSGGDASQVYGVRDASGNWVVQEAKGFGMFQLGATKDGFPIVAAIDAADNDSFTLATSTANPALFLDSEPIVETPVVDQAPPPAKRPPARDPPGIPTTGAWEDIAVITTLVGFGFAGMAAKGAAFRVPRWFLTMFAALGGFSRLNKDKLLEHQVRELIVEAVRSSPGTRASAVREDLDLAKTTFFYHLSRLTNDGLLRIQRANRILTLYPGGGSLPPPPAALLQADQQLLALMQTTPPATATEYARRLSAEPRTVRLRLQRLARTGAVQSSRTNARDVRWAPVRR